MTKEELIANMKCLHERCTAALLAATGDPTITPLYIYDNVALQKGAKMRDMGLTCHHHVKTPAHSPDFNKPIEHCWNQLKQKLLTMVYQACDVRLTPAMAQQWVQDAWDSITIVSVKKDVESLKDTWLIIKTPAGQTVLTSKRQPIEGSEGDYPSSSVYR